MSRYRGPRIKKVYRLGALPGLLQKEFKYRKGRDPKKKRLRYRKRSKEYSIRLAEKQKLRFHYGLTERQLVRYMRIAGKSKGSTGQVLLQLLEMRLDNILFRLGMALTIRGARQLVNHRHILVNGRIIDIPSYRCKPGDIITTKNKQSSKDLIRKYIALCTRKRKKVSKHLRKLPKHLSIGSKKEKAQVNKIIDRKEVGLRIKESLVVEYYSRQI
jgi:small subunit ribosomal protein S4|uniref:Small ribosomal subunit protein uS4c n=1 Tax=Juncus fauriei TaxID=2980169 RepID=A0AAU7AMD6_9POAL|nr:ribosomal protein S4 [Juncus compressus]YP_010291347.1 ribosomal protein S4 [Juncus tenuis]ULQ66722.1 ribosomal protein S4 [Juncus compressus]ULQ67010.1 ribosomal protein S4 [Juncus tenuis]